MKAILGLEFTTFQQGDFGDLAAKQTSVAVNFQFRPPERKPTENEGDDILAGVPGDGDEGAGDQIHMEEEVPVESEAKEQDDEEEFKKKYKTNKVVTMMLCVPLYSKSASEVLSGTQEFSSWIPAWANPLRCWAGV